MHKPFNEYIKECREHSGLILEEAAYMLNVCRRSLCDYEKGDTRVPDDIAFKMANLYHAPDIPYHWLANTKCGSEVLPELISRPLSENILDTLAGIDGLQKEMPTLVSIGRDGVIDETESNIFQKLIITCFKPFTRSMFALSLVNFPNKKATDIGVSAAHMKFLSK